MSVGEGNHAKLVRPLLDTGAAQSFIREEFVPKSLIRRTRYGAVGTQGEAVQVVGEAKLPISIQNFDTDHRFLVVSNLQEEGLIGADFVDRHVSSINPSEAMMGLGEHNIRLIVKRGVRNLNNLSTRTVRVGRDTVLIPCRRNLVTCVVGTPRDTEGLVESGQENHRLNKKGLWLGNAIVQVKDCMTLVPIINCTEEEIILEAGTKIGIFDTNGYEHVNDVPIRNMTTTKQQKSDMPLVNLENSDLNDHQKEQVFELLRQYKDVFAVDKNDLGSYNQSKVRIELTEGARPLKQPLRRSTAEEKRIIKEEVNRMLKAGIIEPSQSPWSSPVVLVRKKNGEIRFCVDFRYLNSVTVKDAFPLPRIDDTLDALGGAKWFSTFDLQAGFNQLEIDEQSRPLTSFSTMQGQYHFRKLPFGVSQGPAAMQSVIQNVFSNILFDEILAYIDDIIVFSRTFEEHLVRLEHALMRFRSSGLKVKPAKTHIARKEVEYLGFLVSAKGVRADPAKIASVKDYPTPRDVREVRAVLGLFSYYRKFIKDYAKIAQPLTKLTRTSEEKFEWTEEQQTAFDELKQRLTEPPILGFPIFELPFRIYTDASNWAVGAVLAQLQPEENARDVERVIAYASRQLTKAERKRCTTERELIGACWAICHFRPYLRTAYSGGKVTVFTDHNPIATLRQMRDHSFKMARYKLTLQEYDIEWIYKKGVDHTNADALSRIPDTRDSEEIDEIDRQNEEFMDVPFNLISAIPESAPAELSKANIIAEQRKDQKCHELTRCISPRSPCFLKDGVLYRRAKDRNASAQVILPPSLREVAMRYIHRISGHLASAKTFANLSSRFYWTNYERDVADYTASCLECQRRNQGPRGFAPQQALVSRGPCDLVSWDITGPLRKSKNGNQ